MAFQTNPKTTSAMFTGNIRAQLTPGHQLPRTTAEQMVVLETNFKQNRNPNDLEITFIAAEAGMTETDVRVGIYNKPNIVMSHVMRKPVLPYANNKGASAQSDQHLCCSLPG